MDISHFEFSVVVVANDHNPTILNPDFLERQRIVQEGWGWKVMGPAITTPPFATVSYDSGVTVSVESHRLQVIDSSAPGGPQSSKVVDIARRYVEVLPHVRYSAVGINFRSVVEHADANAFLKAHFLKSGVWDSEAHPLQTMGLKLVYPLDGGATHFKPGRWNCYPALWKKKANRYPVSLSMQTSTATATITPAMPR